MNREDSLQFVQDRLRHRHSPLHRELRLGSRTPVRRRLAMELEKGSTHVFDWVDDTVVVCCASGSLWITHDGDPKDVIVAAGQYYRVDCDRPMHVTAMAPCVVEIEFEDEAFPH